MKLILGGYAQGKLAYVLEHDRPKTCRVLEGEDLPDVDITDASDKTDRSGETWVLNHFHLWVKNRMEAGGDPEAEVRRFLNRFPDCVIICDEIGNGIVPMETFERAYRERTGRILIMLAKEAKEVVRVVCGIGQRIK